MTNMRTPIAVYLHEKGMHQTCVSVVLGLWNGPSCAV